MWERVDHGANAYARTRTMIAAIEPSAEAVGGKVEARHNRAKREMLAAAAAGLSRDRRTGREPLAELLSKTREMFLVRKALTVKTDEMAAMGRTLANRAEALHRAEEMLEEDAVHFDAFLQGNEQAALTAVRKSEAAARAKAAEALELKRAKYDVSHAALEAAKHSSEREEFSRYDSFLMGLTPEEWLAGARADRAALVERRRAEELVRRQDAWDAERVAREAARGAECDTERALSLRVGRAYARPDVAAAVLSEMPPRPVLGDVPTPELTPAESAVPPFFTAPAQLGAVFAQLEESNLFLIQQCQDMQQVLEENTALHASVSAATARANAALQDAVAALHAQIASEEAKAAAMRLAAGRQEGGEDAGGAPGDANILDSLMPSVREHVVDIFTRSGFKATSSADVTSMLTVFEAKLEALLEAAAVMDPAYVAAKLRDKERERRTRVRDARQATAAEQHEARLAKMIARAQAPVARVAGKPVMYRSLVPAVEVAVEVVDPDAERLREEERFLT